MSEHYPVETAFIFEVVQNFTFGAPALHYPKFDAPYRNEICAWTVARSPCTAFCISVGVAAVAVRVAPALTLAPDVFVK